MADPAGIVKEIKDLNNKVEEKPAGPAAPPTRRDREIKLKELELEFITRFAGEKHQNTSIVKDERIILAVLFHDLAINPWAVSKRICKDKGIPFDDKEFEIDILTHFVADYLDFGLPVDRLGRGEVENVMKGYFSREFEEDTPAADKLLS
jgi:hypothetical protein